MLELKKPYNQEPKVPESTRLEILERQVRDRHPIIGFPPAKGEGISSEEIESWVTDMCTQTFSVAFNYFVGGKLTFDNTKIFCSEGILLNILHATEKCNFSPKQIAAIDGFLQQKVIPYLQKKYPLTDGTVVNRALQAKLENLDNLENLSNDFLHNGHIRFPTKPQYIEQIMRTINLALKQIDSTPINYKAANGKRPKSYYEDFRNEMIELFETPQNLLKDSKDHTQKQKDEYMERVKKYTTYEIGRKLNENIEQFSQREIANGNMHIKHPSVLRFLVKWVEQLLQIFENPTYIFEKIEEVSDRSTNNPNILTQELKIKLSKFLMKQQLKVQQYKMNLLENLYSQQAYHFKNNLKQDDTLFIPKYEKGMGKQAVQTVKMMHHYIILLLNRLIQGLNNATQELYKTMKNQYEYEDWKSPPNLVIFNIGDLMRCKCSSKQDEILLIFNKLKEMSKNNPQKLKIIRVKNRLRLSTNDILINIKYNNLIVGEIQLAVNAKKSDFISCSNKFSHYLYELQRTIFGPTSQFCSIWSNLDPRREEFINIIESSQKKKLSVEQISQRQMKFNEKKCDHFFLRYPYPSQCDLCHNSYYHNRYLVEVRKCQTCGMIKCCHCRQSTLNQTLIKRIFLGDYYYQLQNNKICTQKNQIPKYGIMTKIQSSFAQPKFFTKVQGHGNSYLVTEQNWVPKVLVTLNNQKDRKILFEKYHIFSFEEAYTFFSFNKEKIDNIFLTRNYIEKCRVSEKSTLVLTGKKISREDCQEFRDYFNTINILQYCKILKRLQMVDNSIQDPSFLVNTFPNLNHLSIDRNPIKTLQPICRMKALTTLIARNLKNNQLTIPEGISELTQLQTLNLSFNKIVSIPQNLCKLKNLKILIIKYNELTVLPQAISQLKQLTVLKLKGNKNLSIISEDICKLSKLTTLNLQNCGISVIPESIKNLRNLNNLILSKNSIQQLPKKDQIYRNLSKLTLLQLNSNQLTSIPQQLGCIINLEELNLSHNRINQFIIIYNYNLKRLILDDNQISCISSLQLYPNLEEISLENNKLTKFCNIPNNVSKLIKLNLANNSFTQIGEEITGHQKLKHLNLSQNKITIIPDSISKQMINLSELLLDKNQISQIPKSLSEVSLKIFSISYNKLTQLTKDSLHKYHYMNKFNVSHNEITQISSDYFTQIVDINLSYNHIKCLDLSSIKKSPTTKIQLRHNDLKQVPRQITKLTNLSYIDLGANQISKLQSWMDELEVKKISIYIDIKGLTEVKCKQMDQLILQKNEEQLQLKRGNTIQAFTSLSRNMSYN